MFRVRITSIKPSEAVAKAPEPLFEEAVALQLALDPRVLCALYNVGCEKRLKNWVSAVTQCTQEELGTLLDSMWEIDQQVMFFTLFLQKEGMPAKLQQWVMEASPGAVHFARNVTINEEMASAFPAYVVDTCSEVADKMW